MLLAPFQNEVTHFVSQHNLEIPVGDRMLDLTSEIGELAKVILEATDYSRRDFHLGSLGRGVGRCALFFDLSGEQHRYRFTRGAQGSDDQISGAPGAQGRCWL